MGWSTSGDADDRPTEEIAFAFAVRDIAIEADGSLVALAEDGQVYRSVWTGGMFETLTLTGDWNGDGLLEDAGVGNGILIGGPGQDHVFVAGIIHVSDEPEQFVMRLSPGGLTPIARWKIEEGESWKIEEGVKGGPLTGLATPDGWIIIESWIPIEGLGTTVHRIDPNGSVKKLPLTGDDIDKLLGDDIGILLMFNDPTLNSPSFVRLGASSPKLLEFKLKLR